ncbi:MAG TPA: substrate-binding domain-containing protein [Candidatus Scatomonas merdigallinarum]|nr:substrate-binding domain-containing protein [Candidatus Scatomonas merdigallinarum]
MRKKLLVGILVGVMAMGTLAGCGGSDNGGGAEGDSTVANSGSGGGAEGGAVEGAEVTLIMSSRDEFLSTLEAGAQAAAKEVGIKLTSQDAQNDQARVLQYVETAKNNGNAAVIVNLVDADAAEQIVEAAGDMKVVFVNRRPSDVSLLNENVVYVGSDEMQSGGYQGQYLAEYFKEKGQTEIKYILLKGTEGLVHTEQRTESVLAALEENGITATEASAPLVADYDRATAQDMISPLITTADYDCIISNNDAMALGAIEALEAAGIDPSTIPVVGIDATVDGCQAVADGKMYMTVFQDADGQGYGACMAVVNLLEGNPINEGTDFELDDTGYISWIPFTPVDKDNVADYM